MARHLVIVNPAAAGGSCRRRAPEAVERLRRGGLELDVIETEAPGDATRLALEAVLNGRRDLIAGGGDGTAFEVVNGIMDALARSPGIGCGEPPSLGLLPLGSGNSFVRDFGDGSVESAIQAIVEDRRRPCDVVRVTHDMGVLHFINIFAIGFVAAVGALRNRRFSRLGALGYVLGVLVEVGRLRQWRFPLALDSRPIESALATFIAITNSRYTGGSMMMAPSADTCDGLVDVINVGALGRRSLLATFPKIFKGTHVHHPAVRTAQCREVRLELDDEVDVLIDGEILSLRPQLLQVLPGALDIRA